MRRMTLDKVANSAVNFSKDLRSEGVDFVGGWCAYLSLPLFDLDLIKIRIISNISSQRVRPGKQCCGSGMFIPDPDFYPSRIPDPGSRIPDPKTATKVRGEKKLVVIPFYVATNFTKL